MEELERDLDGWREAIDRLDRQIVALLEERAEVARQIGKLKAARGEPVYVPAREQAVLDCVVAVSRGVLRPEHLRAIYTEILSACRAVQQPLRVAYFGQFGSFTHQAALARFGSAAEFVPARSMADVFLLTEKGHTDFGVVPVENSTAGAVIDALDSFVESSLKICAEVTLPITHHLLSHSPLDKIKRVYSIGQALAQCRRWLAENLPHADFIEVGSTTEGAERASREHDAAAVASELAARHFGVPVQQAQIQDFSSNVTRFLVIGKQMSARTGRDKTGLIFGVHDRPGALRDALDAFARRGINLTRIESRPSKRKPWEYLFFADLVGHPEEPAVAEALAELEQQCTFVKVLGAWPME